MTDVERQPEAERQLLTETRHQRMGVHAAMADLESAVASASAGRPAEWARHVVAALTKLQRAFRHHVEVTESDDGLFADIMEQAPRLAHQVEQLRADHPRIEEQLATLAASLGQPDAVDADAAARITDEALDVLGQIVRHRHAGAGLVYEAYTVDIEAGD